ncbi:hypothetical protein J2Z24_003612 [Clostridium tetanomorphum]|nr:hypothetical protein [Clostridium tetanomorphum]
MLFGKQKKRITETKSNKDTITNYNSGCIRVCRLPYEKYGNWNKYGNKGNDA